MRPSASFLLLVLSFTFIPHGLAKPQVKQPAVQKKVVPQQKAVATQTPRYQKLVEKTTPSATKIAESAATKPKIKVKASTKFATFSAIDAHPETDPSFRPMNAKDLEESLEVSNPPSL